MASEAEIKTIAKIDFLLLNPVLCAESPIKKYAYGSIKTWVLCIGSKTLANTDNFPAPEFSDPFYGSKYYPTDSTFKYIIGYKVTGVEYRRLNIALDDYKITRDQLEGLTLLDLVCFVLKRGFTPL